MDLDPLLAVPIAVVAGYVLGSVDFAVLVARSRGVDIYEVGSGNPGTSNVARTLGKGAAAIVLVGDLMKGLIAAGIGLFIGGDPIDGWVTGLGLAGIAGFAAVVGHCFPVLHRFRGGKGVATSIGVFIILAPVVGGALALLWAAIVAVTRTASIASLVTMTASVPAFWLLVDADPVSVWATAIAALVLIRHAPNIRRLVGREELRIEGDDA